MSAFGLLIFAGTVFSIALYLLAIVSGARLLTVTKLLARFRWRDVKVLVCRWARFMRSPGDGFQPNADTAGAKWLAIFFSTTSCVLFCLLQGRQLISTGFGADELLKLYYLFAHVGAALGAIGFHIWAAAVLEPLAESESAQVS